MVATASLLVVLQGILTAAVHEGETFSFCMCNPPFFQSLREAGQNPSTAYGGKQIFSYIIKVVSCSTLLITRLSHRMTCTMDVGLSESIPITTIIKTHSSQG